MENLTEKDINCIARLLQSTWDAPDEEEFGENGIHTSRCFYGCMFCKYGSECAEAIQKGHEAHFRNVFQKLHELTGVIVHSYMPQPVEKTFLPASGYLERPEMIGWLQERHSEKYRNFGKYLKELLSDQSSSGADL